MVRKAIADNRLKLAYQSIASLEGDSRQHFDVLLRLIDEEGHEQHASEFIRAAEKGGLMCDIDRWVTMRALKMQAKRDGAQHARSEEHTSELQSLMRISYAVFCLKKK